MKLLDIMKKYDRCVVRESAKLTKIYNLLLKESESDEVEEAEACPDCGNDPCTCESDKEDEVCEDDENVMTAEEFFGEAEKASKEANETELINEFLGAALAPIAAAAAPIAATAGGAAIGSALAKESDDIDKVEENKEINEIEPLTLGLAAAGGALLGGKLAKESDDKTDEAEEEMMSAEEFFGEAEKAKKEEKACDECGDAEAANEAEEEISAAEFFGEDEKDVDESEEKSDKPEKKTDEAEEEMMSAEEFFAEDDEDKEVSESKEDKKTDESESKEEKKDDAEVSEAEEEVDEEEEEKKLEESLKSYRRANHHLFND